MKKILFVINTLGRGGAENALVQLLKKLDDKEYQLDLYVILGQGELIKKIPESVNVLNKDYDDSSVLTEEGKKSLKKNILNKIFKRGSFFKNFFYMFGNGISMVFKGKIYPDKLLWKTLSDASEVFEDEYDLAVAFIEGASTYYVKDHVKAKKKVTFYHTDYSQSGYTRKIDKDAYLYFDKVFAVSEKVKKEFLKVYPECEEKTDIFENILDVAEIREKAESDGGFDDDFDGSRILTLGRLTEAKALDISIEACKILKDRKENIRWYVFGEGELRTQLEELVEKLDLKDCFFLKGVTDNPYVYLKQCDIYAHISKYEGKSVAIREAQVLGKPIIVSDNESNLEQVTDMENALVSKLDPEDVAEKITTLLHDSDLRKKLAGNALEIVNDSDSIFKLENIMNQ